MLNAKSQIQLIGAFNAKTETSNYGLALVGALTIKCD